MDSCSDQVECNGHLRIELEDAIKLLGPGDFVRSHTPGKAADAAQMLCFPKERFTALQRRFTRCPLDADAGSASVQSLKVAGRLGTAPFRNLGPLQSIKYTPQ